MKKILAGILLLALFTACGEEKVKNYSKEEKIKIAKGKFIDYDKKAEDEYNSIISKLKKKANKGDKKAEKEIEEWYKIVQEIDNYTIDKDSGIIKKIKGNQ